jgi:hypothetical protein
MPCYRCAARQTDPVKGASPWKRGVIGGEQVLVCPDCQRVHDWVADLDRCPSCGATTLVRALGETRCKACGEVLGDAPGRPSDRAAGIADEVAAALQRTFDPQD